MSLVSCFFLRHSVYTEDTAKANDRWHINSCCPKIKCKSMIQKIMIR